MNDYKELIYALKSCQHIASNCIDCPLSNTKYYNPKTKECEVHLHNVAADAIEQLVRERDAAVMDLKAYSDCYNCKHNTYDNLMNGFCRECSVVHKMKYKWQWRGVQEVDVE